MLDCPEDAVLFDDGVTFSLIPIPAESELHSRFGRRPGFLRLPRLTTI